MATKKVIIIGAGFGGLGLACLLGKRGYDVTVIEKNDSLGGRARSFMEKGFTFDMGPSWYMMPQVFSDFFSVLGEKVEDYYQLERLSPSYKIVLKSDGSSYDFFSDMRKNKETFESIEKGSGEVLEKFLKDTGEQYRIAYNEFMYKNYDSFFDFINFKTMRIGMRMPIFKKQKDIIEKRFKSELLRKAMQYQMVLLGTSPGDTPGIYSMMNYVDYVDGVWYPKGGLIKVPEALTRIAKKYNVKFMTSSPVRNVIVENNVAKGVLLESGQTLYADIVVSNADIVHTDQVLLSNHRVETDAHWDSRLLAPSAFIMYLGIDGKIPSMSHHNLLFSKEWTENFAQIFGSDKKWPNDPSLYICAPSKSDDSIAPQYSENLFVLVPIAPGLTDDEETKEKYADFVLTEISKYFNVPDLKERILVKKLYSVSDFKRDYNAFKGTALGLAHTLTQTAFFRPNNVHKKVKNMYMVGAGVNPGIGMPVCLISSILAYKRIEGITHAHIIPPIEPISQSERVI